MTFKSVGLVILFFLLCSGLKSISLKQLEQLVPKSEFLFIIFYSDEHLQDLSKRVIEEVDRMSVAFQDRIKFYSISLEENPDAVNLFVLQDLPSVVIFREGYHRLYYGQRTGYSMYTFLQDLLTNDPVKVLSHKNDKKQFTSSESVKVVGYFSKEKTQSIEVFKQAAKQFQGEILFAIVHEPKLAKSFKLKSDEEIIILKPGERQIHSQSIFSNRDDLIKWIEQNKKPLWAVLTFNNLYYVWQNSRRTFVAFVKNVEEHGSKTILSTFRSLAKQYGSQNHISFVIVDTTQYKDFTQGLGIKDEDIPIFAIFDPYNRKEYFFPKEKYPMNMKHSKHWIENFISNKLGTSEDLLEDIIHLTEDNFDKIVYDPNIDVLVEFYDAACMNCISLTPVYQKLSSIFTQLLPSVVLASFDAQTIPVPEKFQSRQHPLFFFPAKDKNNAIPLPGPHEDPLKLVDFILDHQQGATPEAIEQFRTIFSSILQQHQQPESSDEDSVQMDSEDQEKEEL